MKQEQRSTQKPRGRSRRLVSSCAGGVKTSIQTEFVTEATNVTSVTSRRDRMPFKYANRTFRQSDES